MLFPQCFTSILNCSAHKNRQCFGSWGTEYVIQTMCVCVWVCAGFPSHYEYLGYLLLWATKHACPIYNTWRLHGGLLWSRCFWWICVWLWGWDRGDLWEGVPVLNSGQLACLACWPLNIPFPYLGYSWVHTLCNDWQLCIGFVCLFAKHN